jgi:nucleoside-diphosphate-sugar epimerase
MREVRHIFLAGASRGVGREVAVLLRKRGIAVTALLRTPDAQPALEAVGVTVVIGNALSRSDVDRAMTSGPRIDATISTIGGASPDGTRADYLGNRNLVDVYVELAAAAVDAAAKFILVSSIGSGSSAVALPPEIRQRLASALDDKARAEAHLASSGMTYTIIRPGGLKSEPPTGRGALTRDPRVSGTIHRADVAELVYACLVSDRADNMTLSAVDRDMVRDHPAFEPFALESIG